MPSLEELAALPARLQQLEQRQQLLEQRLTAYVESVEDDVDTHTALKLTGLHSRTTLIEERKRPGTLIKFSKHGRSVSYSRKSCIDYKLARRLHYAAPMGVAA
jgi:predicted mannosyl-3-phosphoglycerate phosphatase (HAD superfamily)